MGKTLHVGPVTRIEGHLAINLEVDGGSVVSAQCCGEMFRGFETILKGRDPLDAQQITQRICGVCPVEHGIASILAQDMAYGIQPPENGRLARNIIEAANFIQSHIVHFYQLCAVDFIDITAVLKYAGKDTGMVALRDWVQSQLAEKTYLPAAPFLPRYAGMFVEDTTINLGAIHHYLKALEMRQVAQKMGAVFCGKLPHAAALVPGGITQPISVSQITDAEAFLNQLNEFVENAYIPDVLAVASAFPGYFNIGVGPKNFLAFGVFHEEGNRYLYPSGAVIDDKFSPLAEDKITEEVKYGLFSSPSGLHPSKGETTAAPGKSGAYTWLKAPRYNGSVMEVGALARLMVALHSPVANPVKSYSEKILASLGKKPADLASVMGRHLARAVETRMIVSRCAEWIGKLVPDKPSFKDFTIPQSGAGYGLTEAARGALGHWIEIQGKKISRYQCVVPTTWNCSPRDDKGVPGAVEQALVGVPIADSQNPIEAVRVVRSFDPCLACAVH